MISLVSWFFLAYQAASGFASERHEFKRVSLKVGETKAITIPATSSVDVSKRGIILVEKHGGESLVITALAKGFVVLSISDEGAVVERYHVHVDSSDAGLEPKKFCTSGVICDDLVVGGETADFSKWLLALASCRERGACVFNLRLLGDGEDAMMTGLKNYFGTQSQITYFPPDKVRVLQTCLPGEKNTKHSNNKNDLKNWTHLLNIEFGCSSDNLMLYELDAKVVLVSRDLIDEFGFGIFNSGSKLRADKLSLSPTMIDRLVEGKMSIIAQPHVVLRSGQSSKVVSGGEFKMMFQDDAPNRNAKEGWKRFGFELAVTLRDAVDERVQISTELNLSSPEGSGADKLQAHHISSDLLLELGKPQLVGYTDLYSQSDSEQQRSLFSKIPILGPLFRVRNSSDARRVLIFYIEAKRHSRQTSSAPTKSSG